LSILNKDITEPRFVTLVLKTYYTGGASSGAWYLYSVYLKEVRSRELRIDSISDTAGEMTKLVAFDVGFYRVQFFDISCLVNP
jgi:hypothetical protein